MKKRLLFILCSIFIAVGFVSAQTAKRTVTNADLEKFRQKRLADEKSYRDNYERLGFPSPEELEARHEQDRKDLSALSGRIERENYEREQRRRADELWQIQNQALTNYNNQGTYNGSGYYSPFYSSGYIGGYTYSSGFYGNRYNRFGRYGRGGNFYDTLPTGAVYPPNNGVRINTNGVRIAVTGGSSSGHISTGIISPR